MHRSAARRVVFTLCWLAATANSVRAQAPATPEVPAVPPSLAIEIPEEPRAIDPANFLPAAVTQKKTIRFDSTPFKEVVKWLREEGKFNVVVDSSATESNDLLATEPVTDALRDEPIYLLLDRLESLGLGWSLDGDVLALKDLDHSREDRITVPYNLGAHFDAGFTGTRLTQAIEQDTSGPWDVDEPGTGTLVLLGDVLFVRQTRAVHREVATLLSALLKHGRRTILDEPPEHVVLSEKLRRQISVRFQNVSFREAVRQIGEQVESEIHLDDSIRDAGVHFDEDLVSLTATNQPAASVLSSLETGVAVTPEIRRGGLWLSTVDAANEHRMTAVFDVRDLCLNFEESAGLQDAIESQTAGPWDRDEPGTGTISFPKPGVLLVRQTRRQLDAVLDLLESYRTALKASKPRPKNDEEEKKTETRYYRVPTPVATDLESLIPQLIAPESWELAQAGGAGTLWKSASYSTNEVVAGPASPPPGDGKPAPAPPPAGVVVTTYSVLIVRQTKKNHDAIAEMIHKVRFGDAVEHSTGGARGGMGGGMGGFGGGGGGGGGGGFGGGFFRVPPRSAAHRLAEEHR